MNPIRFAKGAWRMHGPAIMTYGGIALEIVGGILACRATIRARDYLEKRDEEELGLFAGTDDADDLSKGKEVFKGRVRTAFELAKMYALPAALWTGGTLMVVKGHGMLNDRLIMASTAYNALAASYSQYRSRVVEEVGEDREMELSKGVKVTDEVVKVEGEDGEKRQHPVILDEEEQIAILGSLGYDIHELCQSEVQIRWNRDMAPNQWSRHKDLNLAFLLGKEEELNEDLAHAPHFMTVWDLAGMLAIPIENRLPEWQIMAMYITPTEMCNVERDNEVNRFVDLGIMDKCNDRFTDLDDHDPDVNECYLTIPVRGLLLPGQFPYTAKMAPGPWRSRY